MDASGRASYSAWWELIPAPSVAINNFPVSAGNTIHVAITEGAPGVWTIVVQNLSTGNTFTLTTPYTSTYATAEWIEETPVVVTNSGAAQVGPLPALGTVRFSAATTDGANAGLVAAEEVQLIDASGAPLATSSAPNPTRDGFSDCTYASTC